MREKRRSSNTQSKMRLMTSGGFFRAFRAPMSLGVIEERAARAASRAGLAAARSLAAPSFTTAMAWAWAVTDSTIVCTEAFSLSAAAVEAEMSANKASAASPAATSFVSFAESSVLISATSTLAWAILARPTRTEASCSLAEERREP